MPPCLQFLAPPRIFLALPLRLDYRNFHADTDVMRLETAAIPGDLKLYPGGVSLRKGRCRLRVSCAAFRFGWSFFRTCAGQWRLGIRTLHPKPPTRNPGRALQAPGYPLLSVPVLRSSSGSGHRPLTAKIGGSNPLRSTNLLLGPFQAHLRAFPRCVEVRYRKVL